jgi:hypothetical protein
MMPNELPAHIAAKIDALINQPWQRADRHCWKLTRQVVALLGYELPPVIETAPAGREGREFKRDQYNHNPERQRWVEVERPAAWGVALMRRAFRGPKDYEHAGVFFNIDGGRVLHTCEPYGVVFDALHELAARNWVPIFLVPKERA